MKESEIDFNALKKRFEIQAQLRAEGKRCPGCAYYELYPIAGKGKAKGFCTRMKTKYPDKPIWWGKARTDVCHEYTEANDESTS